MQNALAKEQQVPIFINLMSQVQPETIFILEKIELHIGLKKAGIPTEEIQAKHYHKELQVFEVSITSIFPSDKLRQLAARELAFTKKQTVLENEKLKAFSGIAILTEIQVYKNEKIGLNQSGLTTPIFIKDIPNNLKGSITIETQYKISAEPKLEYKITEH